jgi:hypothetical protein
MIIISFNKENIHANGVSSLVGGEGFRTFKIGQYQVEKTVKTTVVAYCTSVICFAFLYFIYIFINVLCFMCRLS